MRFQGRITEWNDAQGYGFITPDQGGARVFVHIKAFAPHVERPKVGDALRYTVAKDARGRTRAERIVLPDAHRPSVPTGFGKAQVGTVLAWSVVVIIAGATLFDRLPVVVPAVYGAASLLAFGAYGKDKWAARTGRWRTAESTLLILGLIGGWPGALAAQRYFRHKSSKRSFQIAFWLTVLLNGALLAFLLSPLGHTILYRR